jgi:hypothetical protein
MILILLGGVVVLLFCIVALSFARSARGAAKDLKANRTANVDAIHAAGQSADAAVQETGKRAVSAIESFTERVQKFGRRKI